jgi:phosphoserine phosphatase RsbU/P
MKKMDRFMNILVVDDSLQCRKHLEKILVSQGYSVFFAENGKEALKITKEHVPALILLDIIMPDMNGFQVMEKIRSNIELANIPVIFLTGNDDTVSKIKAFDLGAVDYIVKPFNPAEVRARVRVHLRNAIHANAIITSQAEKLKQIEIAKDSMLVKAQDLPEGKFAVTHKEVLEAGGDFYDVLHSSGERHVYFVADLSGHDIVASYMVPAVKALIKQNSLPIYTIEETLSMMNRVLVQIMEDEKYMTAFYLIVDRGVNKITWVGAGHPPAVYIPQEGEPELLESSSDVVGMFDRAEFFSFTKKVNKGDRIILITDGLLESQNNQSVWCRNTSELLEKSKEVRNMPLEEIPEAFYGKFICNDQKLADDIIVLVTEI